MNLIGEFERQIENLIKKKYPEMAKMSESDFINLLSSLKDRLAEQSLPEIDIENGVLPFVIVVKNDLISTEEAMQRVDENGRQGIVKLFPLTPNDFRVVESVDVPSEKAYPLIDIDRGRESLNVCPSDALTMIKESGRSPLTIDEGVAIVTHYPEFLIKNNCFSLLASRHDGDKRVPAIWINANKSPNLGWCWDGNPHTWLGSASCRKRIGTT